MSFPRKIESPVFVVLIVLIGIYFYFIYPSSISIPIPDLSFRNWDERFSSLRNGDFYGALVGEQDRSYHYQDDDQQAVVFNNNIADPGVSPGDFLQQGGQTQSEWFVNPLKQSPQLNDQVNGLVPVGNVPQPPVVQQAAPDKVLQEGHWIGLEVIGLSSAIARANNIPDDVRGVLIDEVTLLAAESGLLAGDVITGVAGSRLQDLRSFKDATRKVAGLRQAVVSVFRKDRNFDIEVVGTEELGIAQMEAAPMITAAATRPHGYYGPCDRCHTISKTTFNPGHLAKDQGDVLARTAPPIGTGAARPHRERGDCTSCHTILP
ncbi:MAG: hypothetical protein VST72_04060 [Nitrospirota bacterium]|nr:hypothetical protein [Nitrospirota bacterium]